jgi:hypothetical protein
MTPFKIILLLALHFVYVPPAAAWFDATHQAIVEASDLPFSPCLAVAADVVSHKHPAEAHNHYSNLPDLFITPAHVLREVSRYDTEDPQGHLYGAVLAAFHRLRATIQASKRPDYDFAFLAHYVGDLSQPLHNSPYDAFNRAHHLRLDGAVDALPELASQIGRRMTCLEIQSDTEAVEAIVRVGNAAREADHRLRENGLSEEDILDLLGQSASLLKGLVGFLRSGK